ncbi:hypothetical protein BDV95DRAFT_567097 [Massariosphaeria phaeospora]|uniref:LDB19 N-terminal domain-containing protein n=1 Tax=Massariosphaeria phaeospora TaxID=100035 RepID=A0A7C8MCV0_9PLEO|nr:hypothetical protein BDV95DRAFT_567097 [Massariosphaeria phaeospora]
MPGRLLALVRPAPSSSPKSDSSSKTDTTHSLLPPVYSVEPPSSTRSKSQESLVMDAFKRHSLGRGDKKTPKVEAHKAASLNMEVESPPVVFYNNPQTSTGALISGQLKLDVRDSQLKLDKFEMQMLAVVVTKKPVAQHCADCSTKTSEIHKWEFLKAPLSLSHGMRSFPFSHILPGHLPATTHGALATIDYYLSAVATTSTGEKISYKRNIDIKRAIFPANEKHSVRIFPPTNLTAAVCLPPVVHPIGDFPIKMSLSGIVHNKGDAQTRWRLRKLNWRIEEIQKHVSTACNKHQQKVGGEGKGILYEDTRVVGAEEVKIPWKTDFEQGNIDAEFHAACNIATRPLCDVDTAIGMSLKHNLVIEMVVAEEWAPLKKLSQATPTGAARVLRTQFHLVVTERAGMGIAWDEEQPPVYEDVPSSPPAYINDYDIAQLDEVGSAMNL